MNEAAMAYNPPLEQVMRTSLEAAPGVVIKQVAQFTGVALQTLGVPFEQQNKFKVSVMPPGLHAATVPQQPGRWQPSAEELDDLPEDIQIREESSWWTRVCLAYWGGLNFRPMTLHFMEGDFERFRAERPCRLGGWCGCPFIFRVKQGSTLLGEVKEQFLENYFWNFLQCCFLCTYYTKVLEGDELTHKYTLRASLACCGRVNNCCGATCCKNDLVMDILDEKGQMVANIQKTFAPSVRKNGGACCRCLYMIDNYILEFPPTATATQRALLMTALMSIGYQVFEREGGQNFGCGN